MLTKADIEQYFIAEKNASLFLLFAGAAAVVAAIMLLVLYKSGFGKGMAATLMVLGVWQLYLGYAVYRQDEIRDRRRIDAVYAFDLDPVKLGTKEVPEVTHAVASIKRFLLIELVLIVAGIVLWLKFRQEAIWGGVGLGLILGTLLMLGVEYFVYSKNMDYLRKLREFTASKIT